MYLAEFITLFLTIGFILFVRSIFENKNYCTIEVVLLQFLAVISAITFCMLLIAQKWDWITVAAIILFAALCSLISSFELFPDLFISVCLLAAGILILIFH